MTLKIKAWENSREKIVSIPDIVAQASTRRREKININTVVNDEIELDYLPLELSESIYVNGLFMTDGIEFDYVISGQTVSFNAGVLTPTGHITINYLSL